MLAELRLARTSAPRFHAALQQWAASAPAQREAYAADLAAIYHRYTSELERLGRVDQESLAWAALDALRARPGAWQATPVFFYGFDDLTALELDAVETLAGAAGAEVTVSLTYEPGRPALAARASVVEELRGRAGRVESLAPVDSFYESPARLALHHMERNLFEPDAPRLDPGPAVELMEAGGVRAEGELIAAAVLASLAEGVPAAEIVVIARSLERSGAALERTLARYGVTTHSARRVSVTHTALGRSLAALARLALTPRAADAHDLLTYLRSPGLASTADVDSFEAAVKRGGIATAADALTLREARTLPLHELRTVRQAPDPAAALAMQARRLLSAPHRQAAPGAAAPILTAPEELDARAAAIVITALDELSTLDRERPLSGEELLETLAGLEVPVHPQQRPPASAVLIAEPLAIRARRFRRVVVSGLCEGEFPSPSAGPVDPFLDDDRRHELALASGLVLPSEDDPIARERYLLYACVSRATERVTFSYRSADEDGNQTLPSPFLDDIAALFTESWRDRRQRRLLADVVWSPAAAPTAREAALSAAAAATGPGAVAGHHAAPDAGADVRTRMLSPAALAHARHREVVSAGALETFAACPVAWLIDRQLRPEPLAPEPDALAKGTLMHELLRRLLERLGAAPVKRNLSEAEQLLDDLLAEPIEGFAVGRPPAVRDALLRGVAADLRRYLRHEAAADLGWEPRFLELRFGLGEGEGELPAVELGEGEQRVRLSGVIDRVDIEPRRTVAESSGVGARALVRDYKSGRNRPQWAQAKWLAEHQIQVALYMLAVRRLLGLDPVAGIYQPLSGGDMRPRGVHTPAAPTGVASVRTDTLTPDELEALLTAIEDQALALAATLRRGELTPCPATCSPDGCRHPGICWAP
jgi:ATP-dependent helicase/DNAse subunit B